MKQVALRIMALAVLALVANETFAQPPPGGERRPPGPFNPLMRLFDADRDGTLSADEIAGSAAKLKELDKNNDGKLDDEEMRGAMPSGRGPGGFPGGRPPFGPGGAPGGGPPFGPGGPPGGRPPFGPGRGGQRVSADDLEKDTLAQDDVEKRILDALDEMVEGPRFANVSRTDGRLLRLLAEAVDARRVVEIGTSTGDSGVWFAMAMESTGGHVYTHEIDKGRADTAQANFGKAGVEELITLILGDAHETVKRYSDPDDPLFVDTDKGESIDILFLDADKEGYIDYLDKLMPLVRPGGLVIAHNMNTRQADLDFVKAITENPELETLILLKEGTGVGVTLKKR